MKEKMSQMLEDAKKDLIFLANEVEDNIYKAMRALEKQDTELAREVIAKDKLVNIREVEIEKQILSLMALQQPVAVDLRFIVMALKMNNDLERIGDHAKSIAKTAIKLANEPYIKPLEDLPALGKMARSMLHDAVQSFINQNTEMAVEVCQRDKEADALYKQVYKDVIETLTEKKDKFKQGVELIIVAKNLERVADLATNIAEDVVFMKEAKIIRYGVDKPDTVLSDSDKND